MNKAFLPILIISLLFLFGNSLMVQGIELVNPLGNNSTFEQVLGAITKFIFDIGMVLAPVMLIIAGLLFVTSAGDPKRVETAKHIALYTIIGLAVLLLASGLVKVLESILGVKGT